MGGTKLSDNFLEKFILNNVSKIISSLHLSQKKNQNKISYKLKKMCLYDFELAVNGLHTKNVFFQNFSKLQICSGYNFSKIVQS